MRLQPLIHFSHGCWIAWPDCCNWQGSDHCRHARSDAMCDLMDAVSKHLANSNVYSDTMTFYSYDSRLTTIDVLLLLLLTPLFCSDLGNSSLHMYYFFLQPQSNCVKGHCTCGSQVYLKRSPGGSEASLLVVSAASS